MTTLSELWPPFGLVVRSGDLTLTPVSDDDLPGLVDLVRSGVHAPEAMPFAMPWTRTPPEQVPAMFAAHHWSERAAFSADHVSVDLAVRRGGELVGTQGFAGGAYAITRTAETGSWLAQRFQGQGIGTRMRQAVCTLLFDHLDAAEVTSAAWSDNPASLAVSRKVGYRPGDLARKVREGALALERRLVLAPEDLVRGDPVEVSGVEPLRTFLGLDQPSGPA
ncbi:GNAT family N-acetyltransferase [Microlunatus antarcticus]|uniref:RimJ/RimL family protein N-acetyltransferase n=1 Tax=Microlunatus antarcticus TaxID=53388 RepID=A0A7W5JU17_9ACTN|nr:RimJ/RimL family protein N-acetyltransferase [Microlunatus antarcticus]